ncbi:unnamed protein product [Linum trigynum]|uniref:Uncharacterized protein n=1 Tax=Linum trigynum TaxID=586398 RepID=A0AAV2F7S6_9ROSI
MESGGWSSISSKTKLFPGASHFGLYRSETIGAPFPCASPSSVRSKRYTCTPWCRASRYCSVRSKREVELRNSIVSSRL